VREKARGTPNLTERFSMTNFTTGGIIAAMLALWNESTRRRFNVASVDELQRRLDGFRT
jgi:hypothetical protein